MHMIREVKEKITSDQQISHYDAQYVVVACDEKLVQGLPESEEDTNTHCLKRKLTN